jgi:hypothetical protein
VEKAIYRERLRVESYTIQQQPSRFSYSRYSDEYLGGIVLCNTPLLRGWFIRFMIGPVAINICCWILVALSIGWLVERFQQRNASRNC